MGCCIQCCCSWCGPGCRVGCTGVLAKIQLVMVFFFFFFCGKKLAVHTNVISPERSDQNGIGWEAFLVLDMCFCRPRCVQQKEKKGREGKNKNSICWCWVLQTKHLYMYSVLVCNILWYTKLEIFGCIENKVCHFLSMP